VLLFPCCFCFSSDSFVCCLFPSHARLFPEVEKVSFFSPPTPDHPLNAHFLFDAPLRQFWPTLPFPPQARRIPFLYREGDFSLPRVFSSIFPLFLFRRSCFFFVLERGNPPFKDLPSPLPPSPPPHIPLPTLISPPPLPPFPNLPLTTPSPAPRTSPPPPLQFPHTPFFSMTMIIRVRLLLLCVSVGQNPLRRNPSLQGRGFLLPGSRSNPFWFSAAFPSFTKEAAESLLFPHA